MKKIRRRYDRDFKISVLAELESGKPLAQVAREHGIHPSLPCRWKAELAGNPEKAFRGNGNKYKDQARIAELERLLGQAHAEIELLKRAFTITQKKIREERPKPMLRDDI
jgi:transposase